MITIRMVRAIAITLWLMGLLILWWNFALGSQFGTGNVFGTAIFGAGTTTTAAYTPPTMRGIIGGGIVKLPPEFRKELPDVIFFDKLMLQEEREWEESLD